MDKENIIYIDKKGYNRILKETEKLKEELRIINRSRGLVHKGGTYASWDSAEFADLERMINTIKNVIVMNENLLRNAVIIEKAIDSESVNLDDILRLSITYTSKDDSYEEEIIVKLVGIAKYDTNTLYEETSINSLVGSKIYGKKVGEEVIFKNGKVTYNIKILEKLNEVKESGFSRTLKK